MSTLPTVVILAGGENSRFFPLNTHTHKGALTLLGKPLVVRTLENLEHAGFTHVVMVVSQKDYDGRGLSGFLTEYTFKLNIEYVLQPEAKGMGDALLCAQKYLHHPFAITYPSSVDAASLIEKLAKHSGEGGAMVVSYTEEPWLYGIITLDGNRITTIVEKPTPGEEPTNLMAQGTYLLGSSFLPYLAKEKQMEYSFESALATYFTEHEVIAVEEAVTYPQLKYPWHLFDFQRELFSTLPKYISPYARIAKTVEMDTTNGSIYIENGASIGHATKLVGPVYIGENVFIGDFSLIRESSFEAGSSVGVHSDVTRSIIMEGSSMHNGFIGDSIVGRNVQIGAGLITSNKRMDRKNIEVAVKGIKVDRGTDAMGTVIGDGAKIGIRTNIMPGKFIGCRAVVYPGTTVWEHVPHDATIKVKQVVEVVPQKE